MCKKLYVILVYFLLTAHSLAITYIDLNRGSIEPIPIAITEIITSDVELGQQIRKIVIDDLDFSGLFRPINKNAYIENIKTLNQEPEFVSWRQINAVALVVIKLEKKNNILSVTYNIWDPASGRKIGTDKFDMSAVQNRRTAHRISDFIYKKMTGEDGYFDTRIAFVSLKKHGQVNIRRLAIMDYDGANLEYLTDGKSMVLTPRISPNAKSIMYLSYKDYLNPKVNMLDVGSRTSQELAVFGGMSYAPRFMTNGKKALLSVATQGVSNIYLMDLESGGRTQLTHCNSICTSASASPSHDKIVFNSDMSGGRNLFIMKIGGSDPQRISFQDGYYSNPVWSPKGDLIAFIKTSPDVRGFSLGVMRPDGSGERIITNGWLIDGPEWAPNGRVIFFEKQEGPREPKAIHAIDVMGFSEKTLSTGTEACDVACVTRP